MCSSGNVFAGTDAVKGITSSLTATQWYSVQASTTPPVTAVLVEATRAQDAVPGNSIITLPD
jgi:hypothetical protein